MNKLGMILAFSLALGCVEPALAAGFFTNGVPAAGGVQFPGTIPLTGNEGIPADTNLPTPTQPQSEWISTGQLRTFIQAGITGSNPNQLANGQMQIAQQSTGVIPCGTTVTSNFNFAADRWFCSANAAGTSGDTRSVTAAGLPQFANAVNFWRNSGALVQPVCLMQAMPHSVSVSLQGQSVLMSAWLEALSGLTSNLGSVQAYLITGTGTDEGFGTMSASPAFTPAWSGLAVQLAANWNVNVGTPAWARFVGAPLMVPATAQEVGVEICFSPVGTGSSTDGLSTTGIQLELSASTSPSPFSFHSFAADLADAETYFYQLNEPAVNTATGISGLLYTATQQQYQLALPVKMRGVTPVVAIPSTGGFVITLGSGNVTWLTPTPGLCSTFACELLSANSISALSQSAIQLLGGGSNGVITVHNDKVL